MNLSDMFRPLPHVQIGQVFKFKKTGEEFILGCTGPNEIGLISLRNGSRWGETLIVKDMRNITCAEMTIVVCHGKYEITLDMLEFIRDSL